MTEPEPRLEERAEQAYVGIPLTVSMESIGRASADAFGELANWLANHGVDATGPFFLRFRVIDMERELQVEAAAPVAEQLAGDERVRPGTVPGGRYIAMLHRGDYDTLVEANAQLQTWAEQRGITLQHRTSAGGSTWEGRLETYVVSPVDTPDPAAWQTEIAYLAQ